MITAISTNMTIEHDNSKWAAKGFSAKAIDEHFNAPLTKTVVPPIHVLVPDEMQYRPINIGPIPKLP